MRISEKKKTELYKAISNAIFDVRKPIALDPQLIEPNEMDKQLFNLEIDIWNRVTTVLKIED